MVPVFPMTLNNPLTAARLSVLTLTTLAAASLPMVAHAQLFGDSDGIAAQGTQYGLGIAAAVRQRPYLGADDKTSGLPAFNVENSWFRLQGTSADIKVWRREFAPAQSLSAGLRVKFDSEGYEAGDSPALTGMMERKSSLWAGAAVTWATPWVRFSGEYLADLGSESKGQKFQLQADHRFATGAWGFTPRVRAQWLDKKYVDYYYGVRGNEVSANRSQYVGKAALAMEAGVRIDYAFNRRHTVFLDASVTKLPDEITQSPIVGRKDISRVAVGYLYRF